MSLSYSPQRWHATALKAQFGRLIYSAFSAAMDQLVAMALLRILDTNLAERVKGAVAVAGDTAHAAFAG